MKFVSKFIYYISTCDGKGVEKIKVEYEVNVPIGVNTGTVLRIPKMGHNNGDLCVRIKVGKHPHFRRENYDIHTNQTINISQAVLGGTMEVMTIHGMKREIIKPGTDSNAVLIIPGYGIQKMYPNQDSKGDHYVHIHVKIPTYMNHKQMEAMRIYAAAETPIKIDEPDI